MTSINLHFLYFIDDDQRTPCFTIEFIKTFYNPLQNGVASNCQYWINNFNMTGAEIYPIWLPAGTYTVSLNQNIDGNPYQITTSLTISGIEFNLVP